MSGWLIDTFIYTGVLIGAVLVLRRPVGRAFGPQIAYALWALPFLRLLLPPIVLPARFAPEAAAPPELAPVVVRMVEPASAAPVPAVETLAVAPAEAAPAPVIEATATATAWDWTLLGEIALSVWAGGALAFLAWRVVTYRRMRRELLAEARPVGEIGKIRLVETPALAAPVAFGVFDKVIGLPPLFMAQPDLAARDLAIAHELAHHRGHDLLANFAAQALLALHFFNPIAWYGWRAMRRDQEAACDARVLAGRDRAERLRYAALIAGTAAGPRLALSAPLTCPLIGERLIVHRLRSMAMADLSARRRWLGRAVVAAGAFALPLTASISYSVSAEELAPVEPAVAVQPVQPVAPLTAVDEVTPVAQFALDEEGGEPAQAAGDGDDPRRVIRRFEFDGEVVAPPIPPMPVIEIRRLDDPQFEQRMEAWALEMEKWADKWGDEYGQQMEAWAEQQEAFAERQRELAEGERERLLDRAERQRTLALAQADRQLGLAQASLRGVRAQIARNPELSEEIRDEILRDLDSEIERIEHERD